MTTIPAWLAKTIAVGIGCCGIAWGGAVLPMSWSRSELQQAARAIADGVPSARIETSGWPASARQAEEALLCRPADVATAAMIRIRIAEDAMALESVGKLDEALADAVASIRRSLACSPADGFAWLALFWVENTRNGFKVENLKFLRMSYQTGPNEGWIAAKRVRFALAIFDYLPEDLAKAALDEFAGLVATSYLYADMANLFFVAGERARERILQRMALLNGQHRERFGAALRARGFQMPAMTGAAAEPRPWR